MNKPIRAGDSAIALEVEEGKSYFWCSCGKSLKQPLCDGSHKGTEFKPITFKAFANCSVWSSIFFIISLLKVYGGREQAESPECIPASSICCITAPI